MTATVKAATVPAKPAAGCGGEGCDARDPWPLHHVRHRSIFCRLCTSCVLKYHPGSFCALCFALIDAASPAAATAVAHCSKCPSVSHLACLPSPDRAPQFLCPSCKNPEGFAYFPKENGSIDFDSARVLLAASRLAAISMSKAAASMKFEVERKVKESALARKRAREMLERAVAAYKKKNERNANGDVVNSKAVGAEELKKKTVKAGMGVVDHKRPQSREIEKWMSIHEPILKGENDKSKVGGLGEVKSVKGEKKETLLSCQNVGGVKEEKKSTRLPQSTQDALVCRTNPGLNTHESATHS